VAYLPPTGVIAISRVCLLVGSLIGWFVRSLTSVQGLHWLSGGRQAGYQYRSGVADAWRRFATYERFFLVIDDYSRIFYLKRSYK